ncbi:MAG: sigma-70 family RNA polymerase sigma factor [Gammaproteobacteria bacterium]
MSHENPITQLLVKWQAGDSDALAELTPLVYDKLRLLAQGAMKGNRGNQTLQATAVVHEAYLKLIDASVDWQDQQHFYALAARMMRRILVNHANANLAQKRGGDAVRITLDDGLGARNDDLENVLDLHEGLTELASKDKRTAHVLELHYFAGMTHKEAATVLGVSESTAKREMRFAKAWMRKHLER